MKPSAIEWSCARPVDDTLTISVLASSRSRTKTSATPLRSLAVMSVALEKKLTTSPSPLMAGATDAALPGPPSRATLTSSVVFELRSRTKTSAWPLVSPVTRLEAEDWNTT